MCYTQGTTTAKERNKWASQARQRNEQAGLGHDVVLGLEFLFDGKLDDNLPVLVVSVFCAPLEFAECPLVLAEVQEAVSEEVSSGGLGIWESELRRIQSGLFCGALWLAGIRE